MTLPKQPDELFSRQWFHIWNEGQTWRSPTMERIDSLRKRLDELEIRLHKFVASPNGQSKPISHGSALSRVEWLRTYIGVWEIKIEEMSMFRMLYPHNTQVMTSWNVEIMGEPNEDNKPCCLIMLSDEVVHWLNAVVHWLEINEKELV